MPHHPTKKLTAPDGEAAEIDIELVPVIEALWKLGLNTVTCCQDLGESTTSVPRHSDYWRGYAMIELPPGDALELLDLVSLSPEFEDRMHWADDGAWESDMHVIPMSEEDEDGNLRAMIYPSVSVKFPKDQLADLAAVLSRSASPE